MVAAQADGDVYTTGTSFQLHGPQQESPENKAERQGPRKGMEVIRCCRRTMPEPGSLGHAPDTREGGWGVNKFEMSRKKKKITEPKNCRSLSYFFYPTNL